MNKIMLLTSLSALACASSAYAADMASASTVTSTHCQCLTKNGVYATFNGGASLMDKTMDVKYKTGWDIGAAVGYRYQNFRFEGDLSYLKSDVTHDSGTILIPTADITTHGNTSVTPLLANVYYDVQTSSAFMPYVGAGVGGAYVDNNFKITSTDLRATATSSKVQLAYDAKVGLGYHINQNWGVGLDYTYLSTLKNKFIQKVTINGAKFPDVSTDKISFSTNLINLGVTYFF